MSDHPWLRIDETPIDEGAFIVTARASPPDREAIRERVRLLADRVWDGPEGRAIRADGDAEQFRKKALLELSAKLAGRPPRRLRTRTVK